MNELYRVFGAGDPGTRELLHILSDNNIPHVFMDIRRRHRKVETLVDPIKFLSSHRLQTVPQVFLNDQYIGTFETTMKHLEANCNLMEMVTEPDIA